MKGEKEKNWEGKNEMWSDTVRKEGGRNQSKGQEDIIWQCGVMNENRLTEKENKKGKVKKRENQ